IVFDRSTSPASCKAPAPAVATAMASSHMRMRFQSPMLTTSDTAPMVQKCVLLPTAPKRNPSATPPHTTMEASAAGLDSVKRPRRVPPELELLLLHEALLGLLGGRARGILFHERAQRLAGRRALPQLRLGARDVEHRIGRLGIVRPELDHLLLGRDGGLVVAHRVVGVADPVLRRGQELAGREIGHEILEAGDRELVVAELELVERQLVGLLLGGRAALALAQLVLQLRLSLLELSQAVVQVDVEVLLAPLDLVLQLENLLARLVVVEQGRVGRDRKQEYEREEPPRRLTPAPLLGKEGKQRTELCSPPRMRRGGAQRRGGHVYQYSPL